MTLTIRNKLPDDHPIKRGLVAFVPKPTDTSGQPLLPEPSSPQTAEPDPMQGAIDQIEAALRAKALQVLARRNHSMTAPSESTGETNAGETR